MGTSILQKTTNNALTDKDYINLTNYLWIVTFITQQASIIMK